MGYILIDTNYVDELSDAENMMDENELEPDYYIDRPVLTYIINLIISLLQCLFLSMKETIKRSKLKTKTLISLTMNLKLSQYFKCW